MTDWIGVSPVNNDAPEQALAILQLQSLIEAGGLGGSQPVFNGCRYHNDDGAHPAQAVAGNTFRLYDVGGYATLDGDGYPATGYLRVPADGYYRITASFRCDFTDSDATYVEAIIISQDRDGDWDTDDHVRIVPVDLSGAGGLTCTHWLAANDRVDLNVSSDGITKPIVEFAVEIIFVGTGTNPAI